ncbi:tRNA pseudouridine(38-40) synthase TruA [Chakrabartyella piscis]|uniref:tRNA pseudouridine(38-40) synthase TruA n=1 Tax=Chakrabartyella piscis TaxID=2918914 RepID=UPI002958481C|nr:tRNA pseudouridine(38-40) synthase TruA [Chakrabartyella piscis]
MRRILLTVAYDGTNYNGWQKQNSPPVPTIQGALELALGQMLGDDTITCTGASRTDKGVHAIGQRVIVDVETTIPTDKIHLAIKRYLPEDISIVGVEDVADDFHPRLMCQKKTYEYRIWNAGWENPKERLYSGYCREYLDVERMQEGANYILGTHDFAAFCATGSSVKTTVRHIYDCTVTREREYVRILVTGSGFLYNMVRIIAGTLIYVGKGKFQPEDVKSIIESLDRTQAGYTAEAQGLTLVDMFYEL